MIWTSDTPVMLYGAAHAGILVQSKLNDMCNLTAFIDKRADDLSSVNGLHVYTIDSSIFTETMKIETIVIVCVTNIFDHENIAIDLIQNGFNYVVFCPVDGSAFEYRSKDERDYLADLYSRVYSGNLHLPIEIMSTIGLFWLIPKDTAIVKEESGSVTANIPSFFAFTRKIGNGNWENSPILTLFPYLEIFEWFSGSIGSTPRYYIDLYCYGAAKETGVKTSARWEENILNSRKMAYERMRISEELSPSFFSDHAVPAVWNTEGHFNMISGKHRAVYLTHRRKIMIPLVLSESDYQIFSNHSLALHLFDYCKAHSIFELPYPVYNPLFYSMPFLPEKAYYELLIKLSHWLAISLYEDSYQYNLRGLTIYDESNSCFLPILLSFSAFGCKAETAYPISEFDEMVGRLYHLSELPKYNNEPKEYYNIVFTEYYGGELKRGADYYILKLDNSKHIIEEAARTVFDLNIIHASQNKVIAVGKGKKL